MNQPALKSPNPPARRLRTPSGRTRLDGMPPADNSGATKRPAPLQPAANEAHLGELPARILAALHTLADRVTALQGQMTALQDQMTRFEQARQNAEPEPPALTVAEAAARVNRSKFTVREWCRLGRIHCKRATSRRGPYAEYRIPVESIRYYKDHGLLPLKKHAK
jgi:hypothetical protein